MHDLRIRITESDGIRYSTGVNAYASTLYVGESIPEALDAILEGLQSFRDIPAMVRALHFCPDLCRLASAVHALHLAESDETPVDQAIAILTKLRDSRQPEAIRTRAEAILRDIAEDDRAVCDASSVDDRPGQDSGEALVGVECYIFDPATGDSSKDAMHGPSSAGGRRGVVTSVKVYGDDLWYALDHTGFFRHARPVYLGLPEVTP